MLRGAFLIATAMAASFLLSACGANELADAYERGWNHGSALLNEQVTEERAYRFCDKGLAEINEAPPVTTAVESAYWSGCLNGTEGVREHLPESELQSLVEDP